MAAADVVSFITIKHYNASRSMYAVKVISVILFPEICPAQFETFTIRA